MTVEKNLRRRKHIQIDFDVTNLKEMKKWVLYTEKMKWIQNFVHITVESLRATIAFCAHIVAQSVIFASNPDFIHNVDTTNTYEYQHLYPEKLTLIFL